MRYDTSGSNTAAITPATASSRVLVMGKAITSGRVFWLKGICVVSNATNGPLRIVDASSGSTATGAVLSINFDPSSGENQVFNFSAPGIRFATAVAGFMDASGSIGIGGITAWGHEE